MSYALVCTGAGHVTIPTKTTVAGALRICRFDIELTSYTTAFLYSSAIDNVSNNNVRINSATQVAVQTTVATTRTITLPANSIPLNTRLVIEVFRTAAPAFEVWVDGVLKGSATISATERDQLMAVNYIGAATNGTAKIRAKIYEADLFGNTYLNTSAPNASTWGDGTLVGFPTDGTQWLEYASGGDTTPPTFDIAPAASAIGQTSATVTATINETGSIFWVAVPQGDATPSVAQVIAGQNAAGGAPIDAGSAVATTSLSEVASGFTAATAYKFCVVARDDEPTPNVQAAVTTVNFTTAAAGDTTPPVFTVAPAVTSVSQTTATVSAEIDETGSIFWVVVPNAESTPSVAQVIAGQNAAGGTPTDAGSAVGTTTLSEGVAGMTASTAHKACFVARDDEAVPNVQATVTTVGFTTAAVPTGTFTTGVLRRRVGGGVVANTAMTYFRLYNPTTGALVLNRTDLSSDANGQVTCTDAAITAGVEYKADWLAVTGETRMSKKAAT